MRRLAILGVMLLLAACEEQAPAGSQPADSGAAPAASVAVADPAHVRAAEHLLGCLRKTGEQLVDESCWVRSAPVEIVGHVPRIKAAGPLDDPISTLSYFLGLDHQIGFIPELLWVQDRKAAVVGTATSDKVGIAAAATMDLDEAGRIASLRIWFDQREARAQQLGRPSAKRVPIKGEPKLVVTPGTITVEQSGDRLTVREVGTSKPVFDSGAGYRAAIASGHAASPAARDDAKPIRHAEPIILYEGLPHPRDAKRSAAEKKAKPVIEIHGYPFYEETLVLKAEQAAWLTELLSDATTLTPFVNEKKCGGFHPDYAVRWEVEGKHYDALICFGCAEVKWQTHDGTMTRWDMQPWAQMSLRAALANESSAAPH